MVSVSLHKQKQICINFECIVIILLYFYTYSEHPSPLFNPWPGA